MKNQNKDPLEKLVEIAGGQSALARKMKVTQQAVFAWLKKKRLPAEQVIKAEKVVNGAVTCHELRPDIYPSENH